MQKGGASKAKLDALQFPSCFESNSSKLSEDSVTTSNRSDSIGQAENGQRSSTDSMMRLSSPSIDQSCNSSTFNDTSSRDDFEPLPDTTTLCTLINLYLDSPTSPPLFQPGRFRERLQKGPDDSDYPHNSGMFCPSSFDVF